MPIISDSFVSPKVKQILYTSAIAGGLAGAGSYYLLKISGTIQIFGKAIPAPVAVGGMVAIGAFAGETASGYILPMIPKFDMIKGIEEDLIGPLATGFGTEMVWRSIGSTADVDAINGNAQIPIWLLAGGSHLVARKLAGTLKKLI